ncbi:S-adenosyl-L-methionine dependent methyltransferase [Trametes elegans]|nr:S-adenosyl-L-methionine dependent methyltransferase [Trametes elegans]
MHPRNPYRDPPDFLALAEAHPALKPHIILSSKGATIDFKNEAAQRALTEAILLRDFALRVELPPGRLCPPVPNRLNYVLWLQDVVDTVSQALEVEGDKPVRGMDIGTGASAIYPLLGCRARPSWTFTATEIDEVSVGFAQRNVRANDLQDRIAVVGVSPERPILAPLLKSDAVYDFTMCNPPFYASRDEVQQSAEAKEFGPNAVCTGADVEMITPGGEGAFVGRMVEESLGLREKCRWYTSMLGKMSSLTQIVQKLRDNKVDNYAIAELVQGQTRRWVIAWSFADIRLPDSLARLSGHSMQHLMPARNTLRQPLPSTPSASHTAPLARAVLDSVDGLTVRGCGTAKSADDVDLVVSATGNTWSRAARRKKRNAIEMEDAPTAPRMVCRTRVEDGQLVFDWLKGTDRGLFESFASHVERKVLAALAARGVNGSGT